MNEKRTEELQKVLGKAHIHDFDEYCRDNKDSMLPEEDAFSIYIKELLSQKKDFSADGIPEGGYSGAVRV